MCTVLGVWVVGDPVSACGGSGFLFEVRQVVAKRWRDVYDRIPDLRIWGSGGGGNIIGSEVTDTLVIRGSKVYSMGKFRKCSCDKLWDFDKKYWFRTKDMRHSQLTMILWSM